MNQEKFLKAATFTPQLLNSPSAWLGHLPFAAWIIQEIKPRIFVELGTHYGHSYFSFCQSVVEGGVLTKCYAVDAWTGDEHAGTYDDEIFARVNAHNTEHFARFSRLLRMTFDEAVNYFSDGSIELLHIDGLHTYEAVRHDFETWLPKLAPGAIVMFHDSNVRERNFGVWKLWEELKLLYPNNIEFLHSHGLGVLQLNNAPHGKFLELLQTNADEKNRIIDYFSALGARQSERYELSELKRHASNLNQVIMDKDAYVNHMHQEVESLKQVITTKDAEVNSIKNSLSWRVTQPLRFLRGQLRRFKRITGLGSHRHDASGISHANITAQHAVTARPSLWQPPLSRFEMICGSLNLKGWGVEVGPSYNPVLPKKQGYSVVVVDHMSADELREKYKVWNVDTSQVEDVDIVWKDGPFAAAFEKQDHFDFIVASHVIEHIPDPIRFLQECEKILNSEGKISLVVPDKRFCFDYYQPLTTTGEWVEAYLENHKVHPLRKHFNHFAYAVTKGGAIAWGESGDSKVTLQDHTLRDAMSAAEKQHLSDDYHDTHGWYFTPESFCMVLRELQDLGLVNFSIHTLYPTNGFEFFVTLARLQRDTALQLSKAEQQALVQAALNPYPVKN